ncbi:MAG TPA: helix-turn-helix domain-containing protein [Actinocatenispora sp.]
MQSLSRGLTLLGELGRHGRPMTLTELTAIAGLHKSTVHRMLAAFVEHGLVQRLDGSRYAVGVGLYELAESARSASGATARWPRIRAALTDLARATGQPAGFAVPRFGALVRSVTVGAPVPGPSAASAEGSASADAEIPLAGTALGAAYLAFRPRPEAERVAARHPDGYALLLGLGRTRARGYAVLDGVAAPVLGPDGLATAAVEVAVPAGDRLAVQRIGLAAVACARRVAGLLATPAEVSA